METLIALIPILLVLGLLCWCVKAIPGLPDPIKTAVMIIIVLCAAIYIFHHGAVVRI